MVEYFVEASGNVMNVMVIYLKIASYLGRLMNRELDLVVKRVFPSGIVCNSYVSFCMYVPVVVSIG